MKKDKFYKAVVKPVMMYGLKCWAVDKIVNKRMSVIEIRMLRWMSGRTREDRIRIEHIRGSLCVASTEDKMTENRLRWFGRVMRREESEAARTVTITVIEMNVEG
ncbi:uncharacterized protein LOC126909235 [Daktulosphaira vitifoliae]|uniref:uncharacterized protein LOC126909235 n=1 Tax=Daktulosphaira vitifoliae TaxID=58002 RepID=UPI0021AAABA2|nr:uncharacterized protein LOC126909235 [Daktulosphaira vitifoliae]